MNPVIGTDSAVHQMIEPTRSPRLQFISTACTATSQQSVAAAQNEVITTTAGNTRPNHADNQLPPAPLSALIPGSKDGYRAVSPALASIHTPNGNKMPLPIQALK